MQFLDMATAACVQKLAADVGLTERVPEERPMIGCWRSCVDGTSAGLSLAAVLAKKRTKGIVVGLWPQGRYLDVVTGVRG